MADQLRPWYGYADGGGVLSEEEKRDLILGSLRNRFDPEGENYDYIRAISAGMGPTGTGENLHHWGSVAPVDPYETLQYALPENSYVVLKGHSHHTFPLAEQAEQERGAKIMKLGDRYYSVPNNYQLPKFEDGGEVNPLDADPRLAAWTKQINQGLSPSPVDKSTYVRGFLNEEDLKPSESTTENILRMFSPIRMANALVPFGHDAQGHYSWSAPSIVADPVESWTHLVDRHRAGIDDPEADVRDSFVVSSSLGLGGLAATPMKEVGAIGTMGGRALKTSTDLPMDLASRMARAKEMGFDVDKPLYHGTNADFDAFEIGDVGYHFGSPEQANKRLRWVKKNIGEDNHKVLPVYLRKGKSLDLPDVGQWNDPETLINNIINTPWGKSHKYKLNDLLGEAEEIKPQYEDVDAWTASPEAHNILSDIRTMMENEGYDSVRYLNEVENAYGKFGSLSPEAEKEINARQSQIKDIEKKYVKPLPENIKTSEDIEKWLAEPPPVMSDEDGVRIQQLRSEINHLENIGRSDPHSYIVFDPRNIRSVNAAFDPAKSDSANLLAANPSTSSTLPLIFRGLEHASSELPVGFPILPDIKDDKENKPSRPFYGGWGPKWGEKKEKYADGGEVLDEKRFLTPRTDFVTEQPRTGDFLKPIFGGHNPIAETYDLIAPATETKSDRPMRYRVLDTLGAVTNLPVRMATLGEYNTVDLLKGLTGKDFPAVRESEQRFYENNQPLMRPIQALGEALPFGIKGLGYAPVLRPPVPNKEAVTDAMLRFAANEEGSVPLGKAVQKELPLNEDLPSLRKINQTPFYGEDVGPKGRILNPEEKRMELFLKSGIAGDPRQGFFNPASSALLQEGVQPRQTVTYYKKQMGSRGGKLPSGYWEAIMEKNGWGPKDVIDRNKLVQIIDDMTPPIKADDYLFSGTKENLIRSKVGTPRFAQYRTPLSQLASNVFETTLGYFPEDMQQGLKPYNLQIDPFTDTVHYPKSSNLESWLRGQDVDNGRVIEEIQPQRYQAGRDKGFSDAQKIRSLRNKEDAIREKMHPISEYHKKQAIEDPEGNSLYWRPYASKLEYLPKKLQEPLKFGDLTPEEEKAVQSFVDSGFGNVQEKKYLGWTDTLSKDPEYRRLYDEMQKVYEERKQASKGVAQSPYSNDLPSASNILVKQALNQAAHENKDWLAWAPGEIQGDRYNLRKHIDQIHYEPNDDGTFEVSALDPKGNEVYSKGSINEQGLQETFGKEITKKILNNVGKKREDAPLRDWRILSGLDLDVGGEGMKKYYGSGPHGEGGLLTDQISAILKQVSGKKPTVIPRELVGLNEQKFNYPSVELSPEVRNIIQRIGLPIYADGGTVSDDEDLPRLRPLN